MNLTPEDYRDDLKLIAPALLSACTEENKRPGNKKAYNMPPELNAELLRLYTKYSKKNVYSDGCSWQKKIGSGYDLDILGFHIHCYGKQADKFYLEYPMTESEKEAVYRAIAEATQESDKY